MALSDSFWGANADSANTGTTATVPAAQTAAKTVGGPQSGFGKWLVDNAPAIGGTVAGIAAAPLNLLDAVSGVGGTALDVGAAGLGSGIGEHIKQSIQGTAGSTGNELKNDAVQGAVGGVSQLAGAGIGKGLGLLGRLVAKPAVDAAAAKATQDAAQAATDQAAPFMHVPTAVRNGTGPGTGLNSVQGTLKNLGMGTDPAAMHVANNIVTGPNGAVSGTVRQILAGVGDVPTGDIEDPVKTAIGKEAGTLGQLVEGRNAKGAANNMLQEVRNVIGANLYDGQGTLTNSADANRVFDAIQQLGSKAASKPSTEMGQAQSNVLSAAKTALEQRLYGHAGANDAVNGFKLAPEDEAAIRGEVSRQGGSTPLADQVINGINNAKSVQDLRSMQAPFVAAGKLADAADRAGEGALPKSPSAATAAAASTPPPSTGGILGKLGHNAVPMGALAGAIPTHGLSLAAIPLANLLGKVAGSAPVRLATGATLEGAGKAVAGGGAAPSVGGLLGRFITQGAGQAIAGNQTGNPAPAPAQTPAVTNPLSQSAGTTMNQPTETSQYPKANEIADMTRDPKNATYYENLYKEANPNGDLSTNQKNEAAGAQKALSTLGDYANQFSAVGGGKGPIGGFLENLMGEFGVGAGAQAAHALDTQRTDVASAVAASLSPRGTAQASITKLVADSLPKIGDPQGVAEAKLAQLTQRIKDGYYTSLQPIQDSSTTATAPSQ